MTFALSESVGIKIREMEPWQRAGRQGVCCLAPGSAAAASVQEKVWGGPGGQGWDSSLKREAVNLWAIPTGSSKPQNKVTRDCLCLEMHKCSRPHCLVQGPPDPMLCSSHWPPVLLAS